MTSVAVAGMADKLLNCNSNEYSVVRMPGKGFCGFHALSYALTGSPARYNEFPEHFAGVRMTVIQPRLLQHTINVTVVKNV